LAHFCFPLLFLNVTDDRENEDEGSKRASVQNGQAWRGTNFALGKHVTKVSLQKGMIVASKCSCHADCPVPSLCLIVKTSLGAFCKIAAFAAQLVTSRPERDAFFSAICHCHEVR
jgi:hypothetical protein